MSARIKRGGLESNVENVENLESTVKLTYVWRQTWDSESNVKEVKRSSAYIPEIFSFSSNKISGFS